MAMDSVNTINSWKDAINSKLVKENFYDFATENAKTLQIINDDDLNLFNSLLNGETYRFAELDDVTFIHKAMDDYLLRISSESDAKIVFTKYDKHRQDQILTALADADERAYEETSCSMIYLTFGLLNYSLEGKSYNAPLVFLPVRIRSSEGDRHWTLEAISKEVYLNTPFIDKIKRIRKIDLSYPVGEDFSLSEYLYYLSVKVKPFNWVVNNFNYLSTFDFSCYYDLLHIEKQSDAVARSPLVKKIAYFNSEFFAFSGNEQIPLDYKYLSLLDIDNEQYQLLKNIARRDSLLIRYDQKSDPYHFLNNIVLSYLLNNKRVLIVYDRAGERDRFVREIRKNGMEKFVLDLDLKTLNKTELLSYLASYDKFSVPYNSLHPIAIDEEVTRYYDWKNSFQSLINHLRTTKNPLKTSINKIINNYYALNAYPLLNLTLKGTRRTDLEILQHYLVLIQEFANAIEALNCPIKEHPFYGFYRKEMRKEDYLPLKDEVINLSSTIRDAMEIYAYGVKQYRLPKADNLKEMKAVLNILTFVEYYQGKETSWLNNSLLDRTYDDLKEIYEGISRVDQRIEKLCEPYGARLLEITLDEIGKVRANPKPFKALNRLKKKYFGKRIPLAEVHYLLSMLEKELKEKEALIDRKNQYPESYSSYLSTHSFAEFRSIVDRINEYRYNLRYLGNPDDFDIVSQINDTEIARSRHRQAMQLVFNSILRSVKIVQGYFDPALVDYETMPFAAFFEKVNRMASGFSSINRYIDFFVALHKTNTVIENLGNALLEASDNEKDFENIFLKRFYYDLLNESLNDKENFANLNRKDIFEILDNYKNSDDDRRGLIDKIICNHFNNNIGTTLGEIKQTEGRAIRKLLEKKDYFITAEQICTQFGNSIHHFKPCILTSYKKVSFWLRNPVYTFDVVIIMSDRSQEIKDLVPALCKAEQILVFDQIPLTQDIRSTIIREDNPSNLIVAAKNTFKEIKYTKRSHTAVSSMQNNLYDLDFKNYLARRLQRYGFDVAINRPIREHIIDILVKVKNSPSSVAVMVDHFAYYSPEEASEAFAYQEQFLHSAGYACYRIFPSLFFLNEEEEFSSLVDEIVNRSRLIPEIDVKKNKIRLMDYLFPLYVDPRQIYYDLGETKPLKEKTLEFIRLSAPISLEEIRLIFRENVDDCLKELAKEEAVSIEEDFVYLPDSKIRFRRVDRDKNQYRPLPTVSDRELFDAIYEVVDYKNSLSKDTLVKMILLSLGYKKANAEKYRYVERRIDRLLAKKVIFIENGLLFRSL